MTATVAVLERAGVLSGLREALRSLVWSEGGESVWQLSDGEVTEALSSVGQLRQLVEVAEVALAREGVERGLPGEASRTANDWVALAEGRWAPRPAARHVSRVLRVAKGARSSALVDDRGGPADAAGQVEGGDNDGGADAAGGEGPPPAGPGEVVAAFRVGDLPLGKADQLVRFERQVRPVAEPEMLAAQVGILLEGARDGISQVDGSRVHGMSERQLGTAITRTGRLLRPEPDLDSEDERAKRARALFKGPGPAGMSTYKLTLDPEGAAIIDAAVAALSEPVPGPDGQPDERPAARRRADALVDVVERGVSSPGEVSTRESAQVHVTISLETLLARLRGGGVTTGGEVLPPSVVRRMACDAGIVPVVLGGQGEPLELGRSQRLFTPGQKRLLWQRDGGCTYPGCTVPAQWTRAHHVRWWSRGGDSDIDNAALLCQRHHTRVHSLDLTASITGTGVTWHL